MKALSIAGANLRRMFRDKGNIFFVFIFPLALILLIGAQFGGGFTPALGIFASDQDPVSEAVVAELGESEGLVLFTYPDSDALVAAVERGRVNAGVFLPPEMSTQVSQGELIDVGFVARPTGFGWEMGSMVSAAVAEALRPYGAARFAVVETGVDFERALSESLALADDAPGVNVEVLTLGQAVFPESMGQFDLGASQQLVLFVFITSLTGASALILTRTLGVTARMLSTPTSMRTILIGEALGRFGTGVAQGLYIVFATLLMFGVNWGDPFGVLAILLAFSAVGAGAAMLMGATFSNAQQASGVAVVVSLVLAAMGGAMMAIEFFPPGMQTVALITPHAWALDAFAVLVREDGNVLDILPQLGVLAGYAFVLLTLATWRLRVTITRS